MREKKSNAAKSGKKAGKGIIQGRLFSLEFFKRYWFYIVFVVAMALAYIANRPRQFQHQVQLHDSRE